MEAFLSAIDDKDYSKIPDDLLILLFIKLTYNNDINISKLNDISKTLLTKIRETISSNTIYELIEKLPDELKILSINLFSKNFKKVLFPGKISNSKFSLFLINYLAINSSINSDNTEYETFKNILYSTKEIKLDINSTNRFFREFMMSFYDELQQRANIFLIENIKFNADFEKLISIFLSFISNLISSLDGDLPIFEKKITLKEINDFLKSEEPFNKEFLYKYYFSCLITQTEYLYSNIGTYNEYLRKDTILHDYLKHWNSGQTFINKSKKLLEESKLIHRVYTDGILNLLINKNSFNLLIGPYLHEKLKDNPKFEDLGEFNIQTMETIIRGLSIVPEDIFEKYIKNYDLGGIVEKIEEIIEIVLNKEDLINIPYAIIDYVSLACNIIKWSDKKNLIKPLMNIYGKISNDEMPINITEKAVMREKIIGIFVTKSCVNYINTIDLTSSHLYVSASLNNTLDTYSKLVELNLLTHGFNEIGVQRDYIYNLIYQFHRMLEISNKYVEFIKLMIKEEESIYLNDEIINRKLKICIINLLVDGIKNKYFMITKVRIEAITYELLMKYIKSLIEIIEELKIEGEDYDNLGVLNNDELMEEMENIVEEIGCKERIEMIKGKYIEYATSKEEEEIPEEFLDPLMCTEIKIPYYLPDSKLIVDKMTIMNHLLYHMNDPFNRKELTIERLEETQRSEEGKERIEEYNKRYEEWKRK